MDINQNKSLQVFLIVFLCLIIYAPSLKNGFIWDDNENIYNSPWIKSPEGLKTIWFTHEMYQFYPLTFTTFWFEHKLWGLNPVGYHTVNLILHILNALLFFWLALQICPRLAFISALLFAIHPIQVGTVARITECKNLLSLFFFLLAVLSYLRFDRTRRTRDYVFTLIMFVLAMLSKPVAICFIFFPVLYKWWRDNKFTWSEIKHLIIFVVAGLLIALYALYLEFLYHISVRGEVLNLTFLERFILSGRIIFFYMYKIFLPRNFMFFYPLWAVNTAIWWQWLFSAAVGLILGALIHYRKTIGRGALAFFAFYLISIFPVSGFMNVYGMRISFVADHFSYLSTPVLLLLLCASVTFFFDKLRTGFPWLYSKTYRIIKSSLFSLAVIYLCSESMLLTRNYKNDFTLWSNLIKKDPGSWLAYNFLALYGKPEEALPLYNKAIEINPYFAEAYINRGQLYQNQGNLNQALLDYNRAIQINPHLDLTYNNRGGVYYSLGNLNQAISDYSRAIEINPNFANAYYNRAVVYFKKREYIKSWEDVHKAQRLKSKVSLDFIEQLKRDSGKRE